MTVKKIHSYLVSPGKGDPKASQVQGTEILPAAGRMYGMLEGIFQEADKECNILISFNVGNDGQQKNRVREELIAFLKAPTQENGLILAKRLQEVTTGKSGLGLLFFTVGENSKNKPKIVISRFPADQGIVAETTGGNLTVEFVEKVFMKNANAYKSAVYQGTSHDEDFWDGGAIDRQINFGNLANYWIRDFLQSDFKITPQTGTKQFALALKEASKSVTDKRAKEELVAAGQLAKGLGGKVTSVNEFVKQYNLSEPARDALVKELPNEKIAATLFKFDSEEFSRHVKFTSKELDNGAILTSPSGKFDDIFTTSKVDGKDGELEFSTRGKIISEKLKGKKF